MKSQISKLLPWETGEGEEMVAMLTPVGFFTREPLYLTTEYDNADIPLVTVCRDTLYVLCGPELAMAAEENGGTSLAIPSLSVMIPGMCGHYLHGAAVYVVLN